MQLRTRAAIAALLCVVAYPAALAAQDSTSGALRVGDVFPHLAGQSISGVEIDVPTKGASKPTVVVVSFSREGGRDAQRWAEQLLVEPLRHETDLVVVAELQSVPSLLRGPIIYTIKRGVPADLRAHMLILVRDENAWKQRLAVTSTARSYLLLIDSTGRVRWRSGGPYDDDAVAQLRAAIGALVTAGEPGA